MKSQEGFYPLLAEVCKGVYARYSQLGLKVRAETNLYHHYFIFNHSYFKYLKMTAGQ